jgi:DNA-binding transcriptional MerR regulator
MKIRDLVRRTGVSKETVHYYIREGLLPRPRKRGRNTADYDERFVERILLVKELQDNHFLPLSVIKSIIKFQKKSPEYGENLLRLSSDHFRPVDRLLPIEIIGEEEFCKATGLGEPWLAKMEAWKIITPVFRKEEKTYSQDDITIGRLVVEMGKIGLGPRDGFDPEALKHYRDLFQEIVAMSYNYFQEATLDRLTPEEYSRRMLQGREIMSTFFYHLYRKLSREEYNQMLITLQAQASGTEASGREPKPKPAAPPLDKRSRKGAL